LPTTGPRSALIQDFHDLLVGVIINQSIVLSNDLRRYRPEFYEVKGFGKSSVFVAPPLNRTWTVMGSSLRAWQAVISAT
jgi:hypothetical protein